MSLLDDDLKETFINDALQKLESFSLDLQNALEDEYIDYDEYQKALLKKNIEDTENFKNFLANLKES